MSEGTKGSMNNPIVAIEYKAPVDGIPSCRRYYNRDVRSTEWADGVSQVVSVVQPAVRSLK
jgi:hypothetical protein